ncbi:NYN domain-containing protein [Aristophania vespae]|uniref:NYN domain-containing protein n=1 Tax=Aristophania vespae TaxID=2697033 RepID=A0A6P1NFL6_9PROT|nr:NYN domain-containing protein [Aristophania vespae]
MLFSRNDKTSLFIDGLNLYHASRALGFEIDFKGLRQFFVENTHFIRANYYASMIESDEHSPLRPLADWLVYNGYHLIIKKAREYTDHCGKKRIKGGVSVDLAVDLLQQSKRLDHVVIMSGDSDLRRAVSALQDKGIRVTLISTIKTPQPMISNDLRRQADQFIELNDIAHHFIRTG